MKHILLLTCIINALATNIIAEDLPTIDTSYGTLSIGSNSRRMIYFLQYDSIEHYSSRECSYIRFEANDSFFNMDFVCHIQFMDSCWALAFKKIALKETLSIDVGYPTQYPDILKNQIN